MNEKCDGIAAGLWMEPPVHTHTPFIENEI